MCRRPFIRVYILSVTSMHWRDGASVWLLQRELVQNFGHHIMSNSRLLHRQCIIAEASRSHMQYQSYMHLTLLVSRIPTIVQEVHCLVHPSV